MINPQQFLNEKTYLRLQMISWGLRVSSFLLLTGVGIYVKFDTPLERAVKLSGVATAGLMAVGARMTAASTQQQEEYRTVTQEVLLEGYTQQLMHALKPQEPQLEEGYGQQLIHSLQPKEPVFVEPETKDAKVASLNDVGKQTHVLIIGETGAGKSTLATEIANRLGGIVLVVDPHASPGDWPGLEVVGRERNYAAIAAVMTAQLNEMNRRYALRAKGQPYGYELTTIVDEGAAIAKSPECKKIFPEWFSTLGCEARKVQMRMIILTQGQSAKTLNIEGQTELRSNFCLLRLGKFAIKYAKTLKDPALIDYLERLPRPAMLDDLPLLIPNLKGGLMPMKSPSFSPAPVPEPISDPTTVQKLEALLKLDCPEGESVQAVTEPAGNAETFDPLDPEISSALRQQVLQLDSLGYSQDKLILELWNIKRSSSKKYKAVRRKYRQIMAESNRPLKGKPWGEDPEDLA